ncbi:MAG: hypothetical protein WCH09_09135, partial [Bacteroidota bacterium]
MASTVDLKCRGGLSFFAQIGLLILPKSEVNRCQSRKFGQLIPTHINKKAPASPGLFILNSNNAESVAIKNARLQRRK